MHTLLLNSYRESLWTSSVPCEGFRALRTQLSGKLFYLAYQMCFLLLLFSFDTRNQVVAPAELHDRFSDIRFVRLSTIKYVHFTAFHIFLFLFLFECLVALRTAKKVLLLVKCVYPCTLLFVTIFVGITCLLLRRMTIVLY